jgi:acyl-CoA reductase-like NAD-dependent aldehyde dehydrogenase
VGHEGRRRLFVIRGTINTTALNSASSRSQNYSFANNGTNGSKMLTIPLQINGEDVTTSKTFDVFAPNTGKVIHQAYAATIPEAIKAVEAAEAAFQSWADTPPNIKRNIILKAADVLERRTEEVGKWEEEEAGATTFYASGFDVPTAVNGLKEVAGKISGIVGTVPALQDPSRSAMVMKEPYGVVLGIAPWFVPPFLFSSVHHAKL